RLVPQSFYYFYAVTQLDSDRSPIISVPSGNFGNLTAGLIAKKMGLRIHRFIAATNRNDVFPEYLQTGVMRPRPSVPTISNAMDVGNPSNFERMLHLYRDQLSMSKDIFASSSSDDETRKCIAEVYQQTKYVLDPHGAVAYSGIQKYKDHFSENYPYIFLETAHPAKFADSVEAEIGRKVEMPPRLAACLQQSESVTLIGTDYQEFKSFLL
ncbi:MAG TPA: pyridoxal-phosphate dependent enzyme, partial [Acidobacteriota bacterium]|nr:pyridoxal-phosphate dependent enzyme [Acidobacteriota bacterium]